MQLLPDADLFPNGTSALVETLVKTLNNPSAGIPERSAAATKLVVLQDRPETIQLVLEQMNELTSPDLSSELIDALSKSRDPKTGPALVQHLPKLTPAARRYQIAALLRRGEAVRVGQTMSCLQPGCFRSDRLVRVENPEREHFDAFHDLARLRESVCAGNRVVDLAPVDYGHEQRLLGIPAIAETRDYVNKVLKLYKIYRHVT